MEALKTKICSKCKKNKNITEFRKIKTQNGKYRLYYYCNDCEKEYKKEYNKKYWQEKKEYFNNYKQEHREEILKYKREHRKKHREMYLKSSKKYHQKNKEREKIYRKEYELKNAERIQKRKKQYAKNNREKINKQCRIYSAKRRKEDKIYAFKIRIRGTIYKSLARKGYTKRSKTYKILGCDFETVYSHLLQTFKDNYGYEWNGIELVHIDHIKPLKYAQTEEEVIKLCYYTNLQLLKAEDNMHKGAKLDWKL